MDLLLVSTVDITHLNPFKNLYGGPSLLENVNFHRPFFI